MEYWDLVFYNFIGLIKSFLFLGTIISTVLFANWCFKLEEENKDRKKVVRNITFWGSLVLILPITMCFIPF